jgi:ankyrin repeat protein
MSELVGSPVSPVHRELFEAAENGDVAVLARLLDEDPEKLHAVTEPYELTLLHLAASAGHLAAVELLLDRGLDVNARDKGDNTYPMHWAAAGGYLDVVRRLAAGGGDVIGRGDDHGLEVIGWATG